MTKIKLIWNCSWLQTSIKIPCKKHLRSNVTIENATEILARSYQIGCIDLQLAAFEFIAKNIGKIVKNEKWHELYQYAFSAIPITDVV